MRFRHPDGTVIHLAYCTNVHRAENLAGVIDQLGRFGEPIRERLGVDRLGLGLWLARDVATALSDEPASRDRLRSELSSRGLEVVTLNGFPYRGFGNAVVKGAVYIPDWADPARLTYTVDLARILADLLPDDAARGSISTLPLAWRTEWPAQRRVACARQLGFLAESLGRVQAETGRTVRVGFEPEPGCLIETTADAVHELDAIDNQWLGLCLDACHLAVAFEEPAAALERLDTAGLPIVKLQASAALEAPYPDEPETREALSAYAEPRFLHQTRELATDGPPVGTDDLAEALAGPTALPAAGPWRVHFHMPLHVDLEAPLATTRATLADVIGRLVGGPSARVDHIEVETYTWPVLPGRPERSDAEVALAQGLAAEIAWTRDRLLEHGLVEVAA
jgi:hypothetical protein